MRDRLRQRIIDGERDGLTAELDEALGEGIKALEIVNDVLLDGMREVGELTAKAMRTLRLVSSAQGFNIGLNQGSVAGAGVADHFHQHIVPRWSHDINFMPIVGGTKVLPELIEQTREMLSESWSD